MHVGKYGIYKLPGGGIFGDEDLGEALDREICEETGHELTDVVKLGITTENREKGDLLQISHCYLAKGLHRGEPRYSPDELEEGFSLFWAKDLGEAINLVGTSESERYDDTYIRERDAAILITAKQYLTNQQQKK